VPAVNVKAHRGGNGKIESASSNAHGRYSIGAFFPGDCTVTAEHPGFAQARFGTIRLAAGETFSLQ